jgi:hypothetical protein
LLVACWAWLRCVRGRLVIGRVFGSQRLVEAVVMRASSHAVAILPCEGLWGRVSGCFFKRGHIMVIASEELYGGSSGMVPKQSVLRD